MPRAFQADHDDDDGSIGGHAADCPGPRCWCRVTPAPRSGRRWRVAGVAVTDALHHAGVLRLYRRRSRAGDASASGTAASGDRGSRALTNSQPPNSNSQFKLGVGSWVLGFLLLHVPVPGDADPHPAEVECLRRRIEPAVAQLGADRELRQTGERQLTAAEDLRSDTLYSTSRFRALVW